MEENEDSHIAVVSSGLRKKRKKESRSEINERHIARRATYALIKRKVGQTIYCAEKDGLKTVYISGTLLGVIKRPGGPPLLRVRWLGRTEVSAVPHSKIVEVLPEDAEMGALDKRYGDQ